MINKQVISNQLTKNKHSKKQNEKKKKKYELGLPRSWKNQENQICFTAIMEQSTHFLQKSGKMLFVAKVSKQLGNFCHWIS